MKSNFWLRLLFLLVFGNAVKYCQADEEYCYSDDKDPYVQFGSKTAYEVVRAQKTYSIPCRCGLTYFFNA